MNQRRGYCLSAAIIALDLLLTPFGGWLAAVASLVWAGGFGEWAARKKLGAVPCTGGVSRSQRRLEVCYRRVMAKAGEKLPPFCGEVEIYSLPGQQVNGAAFGRSIGITEGALQLDDRTVEAIIAHELGHIAHGDAVPEHGADGQHLQPRGPAAGLAAGLWCGVLAHRAGGGPLRHPVRLSLVGNHRPAVWPPPAWMRDLPQRLRGPRPDTGKSGRPQGASWRQMHSPWSWDMAYPSPVSCSALPTRLSPAGTSLMCSTAPTPTVPCGRTISAVGCSRTPRPSPGTSRNFDEECDKTSPPAA